MEPKLVYRFLRQISDWTVSGYYSDIHVEGYENVPMTGPVIIAPTHHNEIIDIATLSITIPHRRHVSFWAKSTMFRNPLVGAFLSSSGAIPVKRNPNSGEKSPNGVSFSQAELFKSTSMALAANQVVGIFPEGTSYTQPAIVQVLSGAAWAAVEFDKYMDGNPDQEVVIVPVGIVYTDKSQYQSRVCVQYGKPITVSESKEQSTDAREVVKSVTAKLEAQMRQITVNSPDWETLYASNIARSILWPLSDSIPLDRWVEISQLLIDFLQSDTSGLRQSLVRYSSLLHYSKLKHETLEYLYPRKPRSLLRFLYFPFHAVQAALFLPPFLCYLPAYISGYLAGKFLATKGEEEGQAQFKGIFGGVGLGLHWAILGKMYGNRVIDWVAKSWPIVGSLNKVGRVLSLAGVAYVMVKWHNLLVKANLQRYRTFMAACRITLGLYRRPDNSQRLEQYVRPPPPPSNRFIRKRQQNQEQIEPLPPVSPSLLVKQVLEEREVVVQNLTEYWKNHSDEAKKLAVLGALLE